MQFIHIIISTRGTWVFVLSERECAFGNECVFMGRSGRVHRLRKHDVKFFIDQKSATLAISYASI